MTAGRFVGRRRPGAYFLAARVGDRHPVRRAWRRQGLPRHWTPRADADAAAERREAVRAFARNRAAGLAHTIIW